MSFVINFGKWGGFYIHRGDCFRVCIGWVAFTFLNGDIDYAFDNLNKENERLRKLLPSSVSPCLRGENSSEGEKQCL